MPIFEYRCKNCGSSFDVLRPSTAADEPIECETCHKKDCRRMLSTFFSRGMSNSQLSGSKGGCTNCSGGSCTSCGH